MPSVEKMKKHLRLYNANVREDLIISGIAKMKKDQVQKIFNKRFDEDGDKYVPSGSETNFKIPDNQFRAMIEASKKIMAGTPAPAKKKATISIPNEKIEKRKFKIIKRKDKDGKVISAKKEEIHPDGIHMHINWKDGETQLKKYKTKKAGEADFKKIRAERKTKRDYKSMKLMDGKKPIEYSA